METTPLEPELFQHRQFLLRLAAGLVGSNDAEDLVQEVWTRALGAGERPAQPRAWLARIARNLAVSRFRGEARRTAREREHGSRSGPEDAAQDLAETGARFELAQRVAAAVQALEEPYRGVVLLRYFEGLEQAAIAERLGVPIATVRTRQQRALAKLRERLDRELGGREAWSVALSGWLARSAPVAVAAATAPVPWLALGAAGGVAALGLFAWQGLARPVSDPVAVQAEPAVLVTTPQGASAPAVAARERAAPTPSEPASSASTEEPALPRHRLVGSIAGLTAAELAQTEVRVHGLHRELAFPREVFAHAVPQADGSFTVDLAPLLERAQPPVPQVLLLRVDEPGHMPAEQRLQIELGTRDADGNVTHQAERMRLAPAAVLRGSVADEDGRPCASAIIEAFRLEDGLPLPDGRGVTTSDAEGSFVLRLAEAAPHALAVLQEGWRPTTRIATAVLGREQDLGTLRIERGAALTGTTRVLGV
ncbi:MAG TPA: sigma-70 family RNA polymerase sigma factor, partial [Planctomycetota bacterium]